MFTDFTFLGLADSNDRPRFHTESDLDARLFELAGVWSPGEGRYRGWEVFAGLRYIDVDLTVQFDPANPLFNTTTFDSSDSYNDFMVGARYTWALSDRWGLTLRGDGSFGDTEGTWNASAVANYRTAHGAWFFGYRYLNVELDHRGQQCRPHHEWPDDRVRVRLLNKSSSTSNRIARRRSTGNAQADAASRPRRGVGSVDDGLGTGTERLSRQGAERAAPPGRRRAMPDWASRTPASIRPPSRRPSTMPAQRPLTTPPWSETCRRLARERQDQTAQAQQAQLTRAGAGNACAGVDTYYRAYGACMRAAATASSESC